MRTMIANKLVSFLNDWLVYLIILFFVFGTVLYIQQDFQQSYAHVFEVMTRIKLKISLLVG